MSKNRHATDNKRNYDYSAYDYASVYNHQFRSTLSMNIRNLCLIVLLLSSSTIYAHPSTLNAEGCHNNRKTGEYHCHKSVEPVKTAPPVEAAPLIQSSAPATIEKSSNNVLKLDYEGFTVWVDCKERAAIAWG